MLQFKPQKGRVIFHIDMNCFYASVEMAYNPSLKGKPLAIAGNPEERKGIIVTSSYEARDEGVYTTMPLWEARKKCPNLIVKKPNFARYRKASSKIFSLLRDVTPLVEPVSIDEAYLDVTETNYPGGPVQLAKDLQNRIYTELDLPCSIGIAPNKFLAKMASDMKKPMGITILRKREIKQILWPLPIEKMYGVGTKTAKKLRTLQIETIGDLANKDVYILKQMLGVNGERLKNRANGVDLRPVDPDAVHELKSIGNSQTLPQDTTDERDIIRVLSDLADSVVRRAKRKERVGRTVQLMIRFSNRQTITRSKTLPYYIDDKDHIMSIVRELLNNHWDRRPVRLLGVTLQDIEEKKHIAKQLDLFTYEKEAEKEKLDVTIEQLTEKYGENPFKRLVNSDESLKPQTSFQKDFLDDFLSNK